MLEPVSLLGLSETKAWPPWTLRATAIPDVVLTWVKHWLIPELEPGDTVIWDNASVHNSQKLANALKAAGINLL